MKILALLLAAMVLPGLAQADPQSCRAQAGHEAAAVFVRDCKMNSLATNSPCNEVNPCSMIIAEVVRMCNIDLPGKPDGKLCEKYKKLQEAYPAQTAQQ